LRNNKYFHLIFKSVPAFISTAALLLLFLVMIILPVTRLLSAPLPQDRDRSQVMETKPEEEEDEESPESENELVPVTPKMGNPQALSQGQEEPGSPDGNQPDQEDVTITERDNSPLSDEERELQSMERSSRKKRSEPVRASTAAARKKKIVIPTVDEILGVSRLKQPDQWVFNLERNIFSPDPMKPPDPQVKSPVIETPREELKAPVVDEKEPTEAMAQQITRSIVYEGYVLKDSKNYALVNAGSDYYAVAPGDILRDRIKVIEINAENISVEVDSQTYEIQLKGDENNG